MAVFQGGGADTPQLVLGSVLAYFTSVLLAYGVAAALPARAQRCRTVLSNFVCPGSSWTARRLPVFL
jgi:hypothetical protein